MSCARPNSASTCAAPVRISNIRHRLPVPHLHRPQQRRLSPPCEHRIPMHAVLSESPPQPKSTPGPRARTTSRRQTTLAFPVPRTTHPDRFPLHSSASPSQDTARSTLATVPTLESRWQAPAGLVHASPDRIADLSVERPNVAAHSDVGRETVARMGVGCAGQRILRNERHPRAVSDVPQVRLEARNCATLYCPKAP